MELSYLSFALKPISIVLSNSIYTDNYVSGVNEANIASLAPAVVFATYNFPVSVAKYISPVKASFAKLDLFASVPVLTAIVKSLLCSFFIRI